MPMKRTYKLSDYKKGGRTQRSAPARSQRRGGVTPTQSAGRRSPSYGQRRGTVSTGSSTPMRGRAGGAVNYRGGKLGTKTRGTRTVRRRPKI